MKTQTKLKRPLMVVVAAPSGAGKSTLCGRLLREFPEYNYSVSCTTRQPRGAEQDGIAYFFLTKEQFLARVGEAEFLEHAVVHGNYYGTLKKTVADSMAAGKSVILDIDVDGADQVREIIAKLPDHDPMKQGFVDIFIGIPSLEELRARLVGRGEDAPETIEKRIRNASAEIDRAGEFSHYLINTDLDATYASFRGILERAACVECLAAEVKCSVGCCKE